MSLFLAFWHLREVLLGLCLHYDVGAGEVDKVLRLGIQESYILQYSLRKHLSATMVEEETVEVKVFIHQ